uniref:Ig-like domain-containing protein n=1 Tax=Suricata suricatta TaxID=37032 RepID=A0A673SZD2_SURSU
MATRLLCCLSLCLLGGEPTEARVSQTPRHTVTMMGQTVTLRCEPISGHVALFWYKQTSVQGLKLLIHFNNQATVDDSGMPKGCFLAKMPDRSFSTLEIQRTEPGDSVVYLCASSVDTMLQSHPLPVQKPSGFPFSLQPQLSLTVFRGFSAISTRT